MKTLKAEFISQIHYKNYHLRLFLVYELVKLTKKLVYLNSLLIMMFLEKVFNFFALFFKELLMHYNDKYLKKWFVHETSNTKLTRLFEKIALS